MSATTQYQTFSDLYTGLQNAVRLQTGVTATENQAKRAINVALQDLHLGFDYKLPWAERRAILRTQDDYSTGTVTVARGSTTLTGTLTTWNTNNDFGVKNMRTSGRIVINDSQVPYGIASIGSDVAAVLTDKFAEASVTDGTYVYYEDEYDLASDFLRPVDMQFFSDQADIRLVPRDQFRRRFPNNTIPGRPRVATIIDVGFASTTTPIRRVKFADPPNDFLIIPYAYITSNLAVSSAGVGAANLSADTDEPIVPLRYRHAILFHALFHWFRDKKDDTRSQEAKAEYVDIMTRIGLDQEVSASRPRLQPRTGPYMRSAKRPYSRGGGRYDINGKFDRFEN